MSITDFSNKIKCLKEIDNFTYFYIFILIFIAISSFCLGKFSVSKEQIVQGDNYIVESNLVKNQTEVEPSTTKKMYLASKNGKMYYTIGCSGASRVAEKNIVWFSSSTEAELAGYQFSSTCNK